jgi:hypothetical protein
VKPRSDVGRVLEMIHGYRQTCIVVAAVKIGLFDCIGTRVVSEDVLCRELGAHATSLGRLLVALRSLGLVEVREGGLALTSGGRMLLKEGFGAGLRAWALLIGHEYLTAWGHLDETVRSGKIAFDDAFGMSAWEHRSRHPELNDAFNVVTSGVQLRTISALLRAYDFAGASCVVDVGGGFGHLMAGVLSKHPRLSGILFDQPHVVAGAAFEPGVGQRARVVGGSFLDSVPSGGVGAVYLLKHVLHNWSDDDCVRILVNCRSAMGATGVLLVIENVLPANAVADDLELVMLDMHMMAVNGGRERTEREYERLAADAGLRLRRIIPTRDGAPDVIEMASVS